MKKVYVAESQFVQNFKKWEFWASQLFNPLEFFLEITVFSSHLHDACMADMSHIILLLFVMEIKCA